MHARLNAKQWTSSAQTKGGAHLYVLVIFMAAGSYVLIKTQRPIE